MILVDCQVNCPKQCVVIVPIIVVMYHHILKKGVTGDGFRRNCINSKAAFVAVSMENGYGMLTRLGTNSTMSLTCHPMVLAK